MRVWLGWDDGQLFVLTEEMTGLERAEVSPELLEAYTTARTAMRRLEAAVWACRERASNGCCTGLESPTALDELARERLDWRAREDGIQEGGVKR